MRRPFVHGKRSRRGLNIYKEGELAPDATVKKLLTVRSEGGRRVKRELEHYNLDAIISWAAG